MNANKQLPHADKLLAHAAGIVSAYVGHNRIGRETLAGLIAEVHAALTVASDGSGGNETKAEPPMPAVPIKKSVFADHLVCLECGKHQKSLKRHLDTAHGLTPGAYRTRFGLARDYPMVAADYRARRSELARSIGLGRKSAAEPKPAARPEPAAAASTPSPKRRRGKVVEAVPARAKTPRRSSKPAAG